MRKLWFKCSEERIAKERAAMDKARDLFSAYKKTNGLEDTTTYECCVELLEDDSIKVLVYDGNDKFVGELRG